MQEAVTLSGGEQQMLAIARARRVTLTGTGGELLGNVLVRKAYLAL
jgi:hypothetical protein